MTGIGFTTGCLYRSDIPFEDRISLFHSLGANAIELSFATPKQLFEYTLSDQAIKDLEKFKFISIHAPWKEVTYDTETSEVIIPKLKSLCDRLKVEGIVLHPDVIHDFDVLDKSGLPFLIENMDSRKNYGTHPEHIREIKRDHGFGFVFDVQHAYTQDPKMNIAREIAKEMGNRLKHMHVSGNTSSQSHVPVHCAENRKEITDILELKIPATIILEGKPSPSLNFEETAKKELEYVASCIR
jgi:endonuclease IV